MIEERRRRRSEYKDTALQYWLESVAEKHKVSGLVLADEQGFLIASTMSSRAESEIIAAQAPFVAQNVLPGWSGLNDEEYTITVHPVIIDSDPLLLCSIGSKKLTKRGLTQVQSGMRRIMDSN